MPATLPRDGLVTHRAVDPDVLQLDPIDVLEHVGLRDAVERAVRRRGRPVIGVVRDSRAAAGRTGSSGS